MSPPIIITDFEQAVINAVQSEFPESVTKAVFFTYVRISGLANEYGANEDFNLKLRHITSLVFSSPSETQAFDQVKTLTQQESLNIPKPTMYVHRRVRNLSC